MSIDVTLVGLPELPEREAEFIDDMLSIFTGAQSTRDTNRYPLVSFARFLAGRGTELAQAKRPDCQAWLSLRSEHVGASTLQRNWAALRSFYDLAERAKMLDKGARNPMALVPMPKAPRFAKTHACTVAEADAVAAVFDRRSTLGLRNAAMVSLMFRSGLRACEVADADMADLDMERRVIHLPDTKNGIPRTPALHPETVMILRRYLRRREDDHRPALFLPERDRSGNGRITVSAVQNVVKRAAKKAGVRISPHTFRRGFVVEYMSHGGDQASLMILGGWGSPDMIVTYLADQRAATAKTVYDRVAERQIAARRGMRAVS
jgi:integrase/recombinase XerD